ncbi:MAG TPA: squalene synthase HpnC [Vicinamibacterales bacterium]|nr:squalene synthase HpnC [Vicinamibacterales bacterium]
MVTDAAYARCLQIARQHYENFPVASRLLPGAMRPHIAAVYAFARIADDFADEGTRTTSARLALLDDWRDRLRAAVIGQTASDGSDAAAIFIAVGDTIRRFELDPQLFEDLLSAFRQDVHTNRYATWADLLDYCRRSANPVGRLVLRIAGYHESRLDHWSDAICTGLQLVNFWQDLGRDVRMGRLYVPLETVRRAGADPADLQRQRLSPEWEGALTEAAGRTRAFFREGRPLPDAVRGRLGLELRATWLGGLRVLDRLAASRFDVFTSRPALGWRDALLIGARTVAWSRDRSIQKSPRPAS